MLKKVSKIMFIAMLVFSLVGSFTIAFAGGPPEDKANAEPGMPKCFG